MTVVVVGSANQDYLVRVEALPALGQTVLAAGLHKQPGGKGANQAVAAARMGSDVVFIACVGDDDDGAQTLRQLRAEGVKVGEIEVMSTLPTGIAMVFVVDGGENSIVVVPGANGALQADRVSRTLARVADKDSVVVVQAEISPEVVEKTLQAAERAGARCVLNLAPYRPMSQDLLALADPLVLNESEASALVGFTVDDRQSAERAISALATVARSTVITLGRNGAVWAELDEVGYAPAPHVAHVVDSTGAGDAFVGALAGELVAGAALGRATEVGVLVGSFSVARPGAQSSYPMRGALAEA